MIASISIHSKKLGEIGTFLNKFYNTDLEIQDKLKWKKQFQNPVEMCDLIGAYADNFEDFDINMWVNLDKDLFIRISKKNANKIIKYLYERYPY